MQEAPEPPSRSTRVTRGPTLCRICAWQLLLSTPAPGSLADLRLAVASGYAYACQLRLATPTLQDTWAWPQVLHYPQLFGDSRRKRELATDFQTSLKSRNARREEPVFGVDHFGQDPSSQKAKKRASEQLGILLAWVLQFRNPASLAQSRKPACDK